MSQVSDYTIANDTGANVRSDLNSVLGAIQTLNSGSSDPSANVAYQVSVNTTSNLMKLRNAANNAYITIGNVTQANLGLAPLAGATFTGKITHNYTSSVTVPSGTTAQRDGSPAVGMLRHNTTLNQFEGYNNGAWAAIGSGGGITEADLWRLSSTLSLGSSWAVISANLERQDNTFSTHIGTGMSQSSGVFTFPSTGKWLIVANGYLHSADAEMHYAQLRTEMSSDSGSNYTIVGYAVGAATSGGAYGNFTAIEFVDVTNASTFRCRFQVRASDANNNNLVGYTGENATTFTFVRLGDT